jgi:glycosyltransferase involved in cell wall biosynthesis
LAESLDPATQRDSVWKYPVNLDVLRNATGIIVHSEYSCDLAREWYGDLQHEWRVIPLVRHSPMSLDRQTARARLGYKASDYLVCSFGGIGESKLNREAFLAWLASTLAQDPNCRLCFVGWKGGGDYGELFNALVLKSAKSAIKVTDTVDAATYNDYLSAADCAIQLRTLSRGETSAAALDCMAYGLPVIVNANASMKELPADVAAILADDFTVAELTDKLEELYRDPQQRRLLGQAARDHIQKHNSPRKVADLYFEAIEDFSMGLPGLENRLVRALGDLGQEPNSAIDWLSVAQSINHNHRREPIRRRLFIDVTEVAKNDLKTGIERVVRNTVNELLRISGCNYLVTPVYFDPEGYWRHANRFVSHSFMSGQNIGGDDVCDFREGDIFLMLDLTYHSLLYFSDKFVEMRNNGVRIYICVYDILPIKFPHYFPSDAHDVFSTRFDQAVSVADGLVCISKTVANEVHDYLRSQPMSRQRPLSIGWFHLGSDLMSNPVEMEAVWKHEHWLSLLENRQILLMVGTVEPRKGHDDALGAFEKLWSQGSNINLVICGKQGWMIEGLFSEIRQHPEFEKRLFWFEGASDWILDKLYKNAAGVLVASRGEGFGLPLVEAALHGCPVLARDLPAFREVAGDSAVYFDGGTAELAKVIESWAASIRAGSAPDPKGIKPISWRESANQLISLVISENNPRWAHKISLSPVETPTINPKC